MIRDLPCHARFRRFAQCASLLGASVFLCAGEGSGAAQAGAGLAPLPAVAPVTAQHDMVVSIHHDATDAGLEILRAGGNAVDAAVAVGFALAVVLPAAGNIGGGGFMLVRPGTNHAMGHTQDGGRPHFLDFREKAPAAATRDMYLDAAGNVIPKMSTVGARASGVPGTVAGLVYAEQHFGKLSLARVMQPAIRLAGEGYVLSAAEASDLHSSRLETTPGSKRIFQRNGDFYKAGETFKQPELARTLEHISVNPDDFYRGVMAQQIDAFEKANGGLITAADLAGYEVKDREPLVGRYRGLEVITSPPPSSGGIALLETLNMLSGYDLGKLEDRSPEQVSLITEAFRRAYMDRAEYLGDPDFNSIPIKAMASQAYAEAWMTTIHPLHPTPSKELVRPAGFLPPAPDAHAQPAESHQTTHFSVVDKDGTAVAMTYTLNFGFGSGVTVEPLGFLLNDEMDDFASKMGVPNGFGLIQGPANAIAPGHRPLSSMTPTIVAEPSLCPKMPQAKGSNGATIPMGHGPVCRIGQLRLVLGSPGGATIITTVANDLISVIDNGLNIQEAADAPRFHHQYLPDTLEFEARFPQATVDSMRAMGYPVRHAGARDENAPTTWGDSELIARDPKTGQLSAGQDKRHPFGKAAGD